MPLGMEVGPGPGDFVFDGDSAPPQKKRTQPHPIFGPCLMWPWIKMPLGTEVNIDPGDVILNGVAAIPKRDTAPQFSAHVYCGQMAGWMKPPLGTEVDLV